MGKAEGKIEDYLVQQVEERGGLIRKACWVGRRGCPDRFVALAGRSFFVEVKKPGGKLDGHQEREIEKLRAHNTTVWVVDSREAIDDMFTVLGCR